MFASAKSHGSKKLLIVLMARQPVDYFMRYRQGTA